MNHLSPKNLPVVRTPSPGGDDATLALPPGSVAQNPASGRARPVRHDVNPHAVLKLDEIVDRGAADGAGAVARVTEPSDL
jgi:hypothetical protein